MKSKTSRVLIVAEHISDATPFHKVLKEHWEVAAIPPSALSSAEEAQWVLLESQRFRAILQQAAWLDTATGALNEDRLHQGLVSEWRRNGRNQTPISLLLMEVDHIAAYTEAMGEEKRDEMMGRVMGSLGENIQRAGDLLGRFDDEIFACVLPETDTLGAVSVAERIRAEVNLLAYPHGHSTAAPIVTLSIGLASLVPGRNHQLEHFVESTRLALARAQQRGGNQVVF
ncbi:MAG: diguanylate cyclase [Firmicutes bacterium]|nr:diguanylate cyclase [Bacillota bacterium]